MEKLLILLTSVYPTDAGDMFVHDELKHLNRAFDRILIFPVNATGSNEARVNIDEPSQLHLTNQRGKILSRLRDILYLMTSFLFPSTDVKYERRTRAKGLKQLLYLYFAEGRARQVLKDTRKIIKKNIEEEPTEVVVYSYWMSIPARAALLIQEDLKRNYPSLNIRTYSRGHGYDIYDEASATGFQPFRRALIEQMDALFPCSTYGVQYMIQRFTSTDEGAPIYLSRLGIPDPLLERQSNSEELLLLRQGRNNQLRLVSCSRVVALKRLPLLVDALSLFKDQDIAVSWTHFGDGPDMAELKEVVKDKLDFMHVNLAGHVTIDALLDYYVNEEIDLFVNVSTTEGVPVSIMEAMAAAIPIAATDVGGTAEIVFPNQGGRLWSPDVTAAEIYSTLLDVASWSPVERQEQARAARENWALLSDAKQNYSQMTRVLTGEVKPTHIPFN